MGGILIRSLSKFVSALQPQTCNVHSLTSETLSSAEMRESMKRNNLLKSILITILFLAAIGAMVLVYTNSRPKPADNSKQGAAVTQTADTTDSTGSEGIDDNSASDEQSAYDKTITVLVALPDEEAKEFVIATNADYLRQVLDQEELIEGQDSEFGFFITGVNGRIAQESNQEWWCITKKGEQVFYGVDEIVLEDGDQYELTLTVGY